MSRASDVCALRRYLDVISRIPRLSREDEVALGDKIQAARVDAVRALADSEIALDALARHRPTPSRELLSCPTAGAVRHRPQLQSPVRWAALEQTLAELEYRIDVGSRDASSRHD